MDKMGIALAKLVEEDPTLVVETNDETGQTILKGMGELHLDIIIDSMRREFKVELIKEHLKFNTKKHSNQNRAQREYTKNNLVVEVNLLILYLI